MGSYGGHVLVVDPVKWAKLCPRAESLQFETSGLLFPSSANNVCGREPCRTTFLTFFLDLTSMFCLFRGFESFSILFHIRICLFYFSFVVIFVLSRFCLSVIGVLLGFYGGQFIVVYPVRWAKFCPRSEILQFGTPGLLFPSSANLVCGRQCCPTT